MYQVRITGSRTQDRIELDKWPLPFLPRVGERILVHGPTKRLHGTVTDITTTVDADSNPITGKIDITIRD